VPCRRRAWLYLIHPCLQNLVVSCVRVDSAGLGHLQIYAQRTPLRRLVLYQCDISAAGLATILSLPVSLKCLEILEVSHQEPRRYELDYSQALLRALSLQRTSFESLTLSLQDPGLLPLQSRLRYVFLPRPSPAEYIMPKTTQHAHLLQFWARIETGQPHLASKLQACLKTFDPVDLSCLARMVCLSLLYGYYIGVDARKAIEELGQHF
jgi:hypothetical protein